MKTIVSKNKKLAFFLFILCLLAVNGFAQNNSNPPPVLTADEFEQKLTTTPEKTILDVRTMEEYTEGHLENSVLMDVKKTDFKKQIKRLDKSKTIFVYCAAGVRSEKAANILLQEGFKKVYHLEGGIEQWRELEKPVVKN